MRKVLSRLYFVIIALLAVCGAFARLFQLIKYTNSATGLIVSDYSFSYVIYGLYLAAFALSVMYAASQKRFDNSLVIMGRKKLNVIIMLLAVMFFYDFLHQCYNLYFYITEHDCADWNYAVILGICALSALLCCSYMAMVSRYVSGCHCDLKKLGLFNFVPIIWAFLRLIIIMMKMVDFKEDAGSFCEFLFITFAVCFFFSLIYIFDRQDKKVSFVFYVFALMSFFSSFVTALPELVAAVIGKWSFIYKSQFSSLTYLFIGIFSAAMVVCSVSGKDLGELN